MHTKADPRAGEFERTRPVEKGDVGRPVDGEFKVLNILSESSAVVGLYWYEEKTIPGFDNNGKFDKRLNETISNSKTSIVCIEDYNTEPMFDGRLFQCRGRFEVVGSISLVRVDNTTFKVPLLKPIKVEP